MGRIISLLKKLVAEVRQSHVRTVPHQNEWPLQSALGPVCDGAGSCELFSDSL